MIKFFLHGWVTSPKTEKNKKFFQETVNQVNGNKILIVPFSQKNREYENQYEVDKSKFEYHNPDKELEFTMASTDTYTIIEQIKEADLLYFSWGLQEHHLEVLRPIKNLEELIEWKIVAGNSAWSVIWCQSFFSGDYNRLEDGLWILPIKLMVHWQGKKYDNYNEERLKKLKNYGEDLPVYCVKEQEYIVLEK